MTKRWWVRECEWRFFRRYWRWVMIVDAIYGGIGGSGSGGGGGGCDGG